jgi:hypothetical protein
MLLDLALLGLAFSGYIRLPGRVVSRLERMRTPPRSLFEQR